MPTMLTYHLALQMLFLATFFPTWEGGAGVYDFVGVSVLTPPFFYCFSFAVVNSTHFCKSL